jgi:hypothetical protein
VANLLDGNDFELKAVYTIDEMKDVLMHYYRLEQMVRNLEQDKAELLKEIWELRKKSKRR